MAVSPRLKYQSTMVLIAVCLMGYLMLVPTFRNGGIVLYIDFEYFTLRYMVPTIVLIQFAVIVNVSNHSTTRFNGDQAENFGETFGWVFFSSPLLMAVLSIVKQLIVVPTNRWWWLLIPLMGKDRKLRRAFLRRIQGGKPGKDRREEETEHEAVRSAALRWRTLEARLLLAMMAKRKEEQEKKAKAEAEAAAAETEQNVKRQSMDSKKTETVKEGDAPNQPLFASLVRVARESQLAGLVDYNNVETSEGKTDKRNSTKSDKDINAQDDKSLFNYVKAVTFWSKFKLAFWGKATHGQVYPPKRHVGGQGVTRIVTKTSADGSRSMTLSEELDKHSVESMSQGEIEEKTRLRYLDFMDYIERWPGRLDEEEIESEGSSMEEEDLEDDDRY
ncbi:unnamed protein product [Orchesella dallaii]|uniref:Transmembrane protein n=1 Tax=Orchesella dallaii TaxID=48710 RepID=A0ABP1RFN5_9HEXA